jgi:hypothetical protein
VSSVVRFCFLRKHSRISGSCITPRPQNGHHDQAVRTDDGPGGKIVALHLDLH